MMYYPLQNTCMMTTSASDAQSIEELYAIRNRVQIAPGEENVGTIQAISAATGVTAWKYEQRAGVLSLIDDRRRPVVRRRRERPLPRVRPADRRGALGHQPRRGRERLPGQRFAVDGKQYVAVSTGGSGFAFGLARLTPELHPGSGNQLFVFALP